MCTRPIRLKAVAERVPCGYCEECRSRYARSIALRCLHEASLHDVNSFLTLTYAPEKLPPLGSLVPDDLTRFFKRLRKAIAPRKVRYYACGEYGSVHRRPHYHCLMFGYRPSGLSEIPSKSASPLYRSGELESLWKDGVSSVGDVSFESALYVSRYVLKKADSRRGHKKWVYDDDGVLHEIEKEYSVSSRGRRSDDPALDDGGIGYRWYKQYAAEVKRHDSIVVNGSEVMVPRYYDKLTREYDEARHELMKLRRERKHAERRGKLSKDGVDWYSEEKRERLAREVILRQKVHDLARRL